MRDDGRRGFKNCPKLQDVIYGRTPLSKIVWHYLWTTPEKKEKEKKRNPTFIFVVARRCWSRWRHRCLDADLPGGIRTVDLSSVTETSTFNQVCQYCYWNLIKKLGSFIKNFSYRMVPLLGTVVIKRYQGYQEFNKNRGKKYQRDTFWVTFDHFWRECNIFLEWLGQK